MTMNNKGAVATGSRNLDNLVSVRDIPYPTLEDDMIIIKSVAFAVNPTDWKHLYPESFVSHLTSEVFRKFGLGFKCIANPLGSIGGGIGNFVGKRLTFYQKGVVSGSDVSGIVEEVGKKVTNFKKGDIVSASLHGGLSKNGGFSNYVKVSANATIKYPKGQISDKPLEVGDHPSSNITSFEAAASVPVGLKTVALSLHYNLAIPDNKEKNKDDYILIWGGATATGILAIQIAKKVYGINVITTASKRHHEKLLSLGADKAFDYNDKDVISQLRNFGNGKIKYALDCVSSPQTLQSVYDATEGSEFVTIDNLLFLKEDTLNLKQNRKVKVTFTDGYIVDGRKHFGNVISPEMLLKYLEFWNNKLPSVISEIKTAQLKVLPPGLESANEGLRLLIENKIAGQKIVFRRNDV